MVINADELNIDRNKVNNNAKVNNNTRLLPLLLMISTKIQNMECCKPLKVLFEGGSDNTHIHSRVLPTGLTLKAKRIILEFSNTMRIYKAVEASVFKTPSCRYDVILGRDASILEKIDFLFSNQQLDGWEKKYLLKMRLGITKRTYRTKRLKVVYCFLWYFNEWSWPWCVLMLEWQIPCATAKV